VVPVARNLAEALGILDPRVDAKVQSAPDPVGDLDARSLARMVLNSTQYRESLMRRILFDELPPAVETKLMDYAWGRPTERIEITDNTNRFAGMTSEQLEQHALFLATLARQLCERDTRQPSGSTGLSSGDEEDEPTGDHSVH